MFADLLIKITGQGSLTVESILKDLLEDEEEADDDDEDAILTNLNACSEKLL